MLLFKYYNKKTQILMNRYFFIDPRAIFQMRILFYMNLSQFFHKAEAPEIISISSMVILACLALLQTKVSLSNISPAFLEAFSMAAILELCSEALLFKKALQKILETYNSQKYYLEYSKSGSTASCLVTYLNCFKKFGLVKTSIYLTNQVMTFLNEL